MAVADVWDVCRGYHRLGDAVARADDQVVVVEPEPLDGGWKQRQVTTVVPIGHRQVLHERCENPALLDSWRDRTLDMKQGEQVGVGKELAEYVENFLTPPHAGEPVVN